MSNSSRREFIAGAAVAASANFVTRRAKAQANSTIRIGVTLPMSGGASIYGNAYYKGAKLVAEYINASGKLGSKLEIVVRDHKGDPNTTLVNMRDLKGSGINLIVGGVPTGPALAEEGVARELDVVHIVSGAQGESITHEHYSPNSFRSCLNGFMQVNGLTAVLARKAPDVTRWVAIVYDNEFGRSSWNTFRTMAKKHYKEIANKDIEFEPPIMCKTGQPDWRTTVGQAVAANATGLFSTLVVPDSVSFYIQARPYNLDRKFTASCDTGGDFSLVTTLGFSPGQNHWSPSPWYPAAYRDNPISRFVEDGWNATEKNPVLGFMVGGCSATAALAAAIDKAKSTETAQVIAALKTVTFDTPIGPASFRKEDHQIIPDVGYLNFGKQDGTPAWKLKDYIKMNTKEFAEPASPGVPINYDAL